MTANDFIAEFERRLESVLADCEGVTGEAMRYAVLDGGKRIRPMCVFLGAKSVSNDIVDSDFDDLLLLAKAVELIHSYSLVHDDMPEMDNDDFRRGKLSVHKKYGSATALLVGDALLTLASGLLLQCKSQAAAQVISNAALDMVFGQSAELAGCKTERDHLDMYAKKTGALIRGAFVAGALCAKPSDSVINMVSDFAAHLGLAFQLADDLLDGDGIVRLIGQDKTRDMLNAETSSAIESAKKLENSDKLIRFAEFLWRRDR